MHSAEFESSDAVYLINWNFWCCTVVHSTTLKHRLVLVMCSKGHSMGIAERNIEVNFFAYGSRINKKEQAFFMLNLVE